MSRVNSPLFYSFLGIIGLIVVFLAKSLPYSWYFQLIFLLNFYYFFGIVPF